MHMKKIKNKGGFTLIEILVVIAIIAILATIVIVSINPAKRFRDANNAQRQANINAILNAIGQNIVDNKGKFTKNADCDTEVGNIEDTYKTIGAALGEINLQICLVDYLATIPVDPQDNSGYEIKIGAAVGSYAIKAPKAEGMLIEVTR